MASFSNFKSTIVQASQAAAGVASGLDSAAVLSIAESTKGALTKSFDSNETANITLSSAINISPFVSATKEVAPSDVQTKSTWDVNSTGSNYDLHNTAYDTTLEKTVDIFELGTGSFSSEDVGKRIVAGGGTAFLTATTGTYVETETITGTTFASGEWEMYGLDVDETNGVTPAQYTVSSNLWDLLTANNVTRVADFANMGPSATYGIHFKPDGTKCFAVGTTMNSVADAVLELNLSTAWDITTASIGSTYSVASQDGTPTDLFFKPDGTQMYICGSGADRIHQYTLSTAWDITTASYASKFFSTTAVGETSPNAIYIRADGAYMFFVGTTSDNVYQYTLATPWDVSTATYFGDESIGSQETAPSGLFFKPDGTQMYVVGITGDDVNVYNLSTAWDLTATVTFAGAYQLSGVDVNPEGIYFKEDGSAFYTVTRLDPDRITQFSVGSLSTSTYTADYSSAVTNASGRINTTLWDDINSMVPDQSAVNGQIFYAMSTDERTTWTIIDSANDERDIAQNSLGTWQYNSSDSSGVSWVNATINNEFYTLQQAVEITNNRMNFTRLNNLSDSNHIALGDTLDLAIIMKADSAVSTVYSDGITINYSGKILNKLAIPGVDYDYTHVNSTNVLVEALQPGNYKFRIL